MKNPLYETNGENVN